MASACQGPSLHPGSVWGGCGEPWVPVGCVLPRLLTPVCSGRTGTVPSRLQSCRTSSASSLACPGAPSSTTRYAPLIKACFPCMDSSASGRKLSPSPTPSVTSRSACSVGTPRLAPCCSPPPQARGLPGCAALPGVPGLPGLPHPVRAGLADAGPHRYSRALPSSPLGTLLSLTWPLSSQ